MDAFNCKWCIVTLKNGKKVKLYIVDVDYETFGYDMIIYNYTGSNSYGVDDIPFSKIESIELAE
nr:hypothetical protein [Ligilactobacillus apodemi]